MRDGLGVFDYFMGRIAVASDPLLVADSYDYADACELTVGEFDTRSPETLCRTATEQTSFLSRWLIVAAHRLVLRLRLALREDANQHILGWNVTHSFVDVVALEATGPLMSATIIARRLEPTRAVLTTFVVYRRRIPASILWSFVGPVHRALAPLLLRRAIRRRFTSD